MTQTKKRKLGKTSHETQSSVTRLFKKFTKASGSSGSERQNLLKQKHNNTKTNKICECKPPISVHAAQQNDDGLPPKDDTFSCTSCALMKLLTSDPPKLLFLISIACVFVLILVALNWCTLYQDTSDPTLDGRRRRSNAEWMEDDRKPWETSTLMNGLSELLASDSEGSNIHDGNMDNPSQELSNILDRVKVSEAYSSNSLRDFYRKLLRTDIHIKKLRKGLRNLKRDKINSVFDFNPPRVKRSFKIFRNATRKHSKPPFLHRRSVKNLNLYYPKQLDMRTDVNIYMDMKENSDIYGTPDPYSASENTKADRYSESSPARSRGAGVRRLRELIKKSFRSFEDTQAFEHLDRRMQSAIREFNYQFPETTPTTFNSALNNEESHEFHPDNYLKNNHVNARKENTHHDERKEFTPASKIYRMTQKDMGDKNSEHKQTVYESKTDEQTNVDNAQMTTESNPPEQTNEFMLTLASITSVRPGSKLKIEADIKGYFPKRRLLQHDYDEDDEDDENDDRDLDYEDQTKEPWDREKRTTNLTKLRFMCKTDQPQKLSEMENPYWNSPIRLYHDDLNHMIKAAIDMASHKTAAKKKDKVNLNTNIGTNGYTKYTTVTNDNYNKLVEMAQAYSDYGLLYGKKDVVEDNTDNSMTPDKEHAILQPKMGHDVFFRRAGLSNRVEVVSNYRTPKKITKKLPIHKDNKAEEFQDITEPKIIQKFHNPNMYGHHKIYKRSLKSVETEVPNNELPADSHIKSDINDTIKLLVMENSYLKDKNIYVTPTENNKIGNLSKIRDSNALDKGGNRTVVKRSANGNIIFWNDLYDDEYGIKDPLENEMRDKSSVKYNDLIAKSENWFGAKFKQIANNMKERKSHWRERIMKNRNVKDLRNKSNITKRAAVNPNKKSSKQTFKDLTANMKKVLHEAAEAIRETTNREARSDNVQAATMMQRLVGLMSELVDIQVQQKTCIQLPDDLRSFLAWLTSPNPQENNDINFPADSTYDTREHLGSARNNVLNTDYDMMPSNTRSDCLGTIHDIQDLIEQYDEMSEEDKSKMSGVREYLEHQLKFLHKQLSSFNEYEVPVLYQEHSIRKRRQLSKSLNNKKIPLNRKTHSHQNYFDRKRTKSTVHDGLMEDVTQDYITNNHKSDLNEDNGIKENDDIKKGRDGGETELRYLEENVIENKDKSEKTALNLKGGHGNNMKRNLQDVYYNALAMAKVNSTTVKYT